MLTRTLVLHPADKWRTVPGKGVSGQSQTKVIDLNDQLVELNAELEQGGSLTCTVDF
jgi:hypothetical protein